MRELFFVVGGDVQLFVEVMKQLVRGAQEFASGGEGQVGGNQEVSRCAVVRGGDEATGERGA